MPVMIPAQCCSVAVIRIRVPHRLCVLTIATWISCCLHNESNNPEILLTMPPMMPDAFLVMTWCQPG
jgi:hypothetical protein